MSKPAARLGDTCAHGGAIVVGFPMVLIGGMPAARSMDMHVCPMVNPGLPPPPHIGGPALVGSPTVLIGGMPALRMGDMLTCAGPPDLVAKGQPNVLIGEAGGGGGGGGAGEGGGGGGGGGSGGGAAAAVQAATALLAAAQAASSAAFSAASSAARAAADYGMRLATGGGEPSESKEIHWAHFQFVDKAGLPVGGVNFELKTPDDAKSHGIVPGVGVVRRDAIPSGNCRIRLRSISNAAWSAAEARSGEKVELTADVEGFDDGVPTKITIVERDLTGADREIETLDAKVRSNQVRAEWTYEYKDEDEASGESDAPAAAAPASGGYSRPEYFFRVVIEDCAACSGLLFFKDWLEIHLKDSAGKAIANEEYRLVLPNGQTRTGRLDRDGYARLDKIPPGKARVELPRLPQAELSTS